MSIGRIFCLGRPIVDITGFVSQEFLEDLHLDEEFFDQNLTNLEFLLEKIKERSGFSISIGGVENNVAINIALLGMSAVLAGTRGADDFGLLFESKWKLVKEMDTSLVSVLDQKTAVVVILSIEDSSERFKIIHYGSSEFLPWNNSVQQALEESQIFFSSLFSANTLSTREIWLKAIRMAEESNKRIVVSLAGISTIQNGLGEIIEAVRDCANMIFLNEAEYDFLCRHIKHKIPSIFPGAELIIITRGKQGCSVCKNSKENSDWFQIIPPRVLEGVEQVFKTGAGDAFCAGFLSALLQGKTERQAAYFASEVSLLKLQNPTSSLISAKAIDIDGLTRKLQAERRKKCSG